MEVNRDRQIVHTPDGGQSPFDRATLPSLRTIQDPPHYTPYASELLALGRHEERYGSSFHRVTTIESSLLNSQELIAGVRSDRLISRYKGLREMVLVHTRGDGDSLLEVSLTAKGVRFAKILDEITHTFGPAHQKFTSPREYRNDQELERAIKFVTILNLIKEGEERTSHPGVPFDEIATDWLKATVPNERMLSRVFKSDLDHDFEISIGTMSRSGIVRPLPEAGEVYKSKWTFTPDGMSEFERLTGERSSLKVFNCGRARLFDLALCTMIWLEETSPAINPETSQEPEVELKLVTEILSLYFGFRSHPYVVADLVQSVAALALEQKLAIRYQQSYQPGEPRIIEPVFDTYGLTSRDTLMITQRGHSLYTAQN